MVDYSVFSERVLRTFLGRSKIIIIVLILAVITLMLEVVHYWRTKSNKGVSIWSYLLRNTSYSPRLPTLRQQIGSGIIAFILLIVFAVSSSLSTYRDISHNQYVMVATQYSREAHRDDGNLFSYGCIRAKIEDSWVELNLPYDWTDEEFPMGEFDGVIWYSKETKIILSFTPQ